MGTNQAWLFFLQNIKLLSPTGQALLRMKLLGADRETAANDVNRGFNLIWHLLLTAFFSFDRAAQANVCLAIWTAFKADKSVLLVTYCSFWELLDRAYSVSEELLLTISQVNSTFLVNSELTASWFEPLAVCQCHWLVFKPVACSFRSFSQEASHHSPEEVD